MSRFVTMIARGDCPPICIDVMVFDIPCTHDGCSTQVNSKQTQFFAKSVSTLTPPADMEHKRIGLFSNVLAGCCCAHMSRSLIGHLAHTPLCMLFTFASGAFAMVTFWMGSIPSDATADEAFHLTTRLLGSLLVCKFANISAESPRIGFVICFGVLSPGIMSKHSSYSPQGSSHFGGTSGEYASQGDLAGAMSQLINSRFIAKSEVPTPSLLTDDTMPICFALFLGRWPPCLQALGPNLKRSAWSRALGYPHGCVVSVVAHSHTAKTPFHCDI